MATTSIGASGVVFPDGTTQASASVGGVVTRIYTSPTTWTKPATVKSIKVTVVGAGGGGSGGGPGFPVTGGNGAAGMGFFQAPAIPGPVIVQVGASGTGGVFPRGSGTVGGPSSFGSLITAPGGGAGIYSPALVLGGVFTPSPTNVGSPGQPGIFFAPGSSLVSTVSGLGFGFGGFAGSNNSPGIGFGGAGGSGSIANSPTSAGSSGSGGLVIVEEFY
jgi:hypothetical protein